MKQIKIINLIIIIVLLLISNSCSSDYYDDRYVIKDVSQPCDIFLYATDTTYFISSVTIHIVGMVKGECIFEIENGAEGYETIKVKDSIDYIYRNDWYEPKIHLRYLPIQGIIGDSLVLKYEFI